jgi:hypothetical protein
MIDAADLATTERFAKAYTQTAFDNPPGKYNYAVGIAPLSAITDYFINGEPFTHRLREIRAIPRTYFRADLSVSRRWSGIF